MGRIKELCRYGGLGLALCIAVLLLLQSRMMIQPLRISFRESAKWNQTHPSFVSGAQETIPFVLLQTGPLAVTHFAAAHLFSMMHPNSKIYLLGDDNTASHSHRLCSNCEFVDMTTIKKNPDYDERRFLDHYIHSSANRLRFEKLCFQRFFWTRRFMAQHGLDRVFFADVDILPFTNLFQRFGLDPMETNFFTLLRDSTYFSIWSKANLDAFCTYIGFFYDRPVRQIYDDIYSYGMDGVKYGVRPPRMWPTEFAVRQFSDMMILHAFLNQTDLHIFHPGPHSKLVAFGCSFHLVGSYRGGSQMRRYHISRQIRVD